MGDRICVTFKKGEYLSPTLYCHWAGLRALKCADEAINEDHNGIENLLCNLVVKVMQGECRPRSYYLYDGMEDNGMADYDNWSWTYHLDTKMWTTSWPDMTGEYTCEQVEDLVRKYRPCLYRECKCDNYRKHGCALYLNEQLEESRRRREERAKEGSQ